MDNQNLEQLKKLAQIFNTDKLISPEEIQQIFKGIVEILATYKKDTSSINEETKNVVNKLLEDVVSIHKESIDAVEEKKNALAGDFADKLTELKQMVTSIKEEMAKKAETPQDDTDDEAEKQALIEEIMAQIKLPEVKATIVSGEEIIDRINELDLSEDNKIDYARLKNVPVIKGKVISGSPTVLANAVDLDGSTRANNYAIVWDATRGRYTHAAGASSSLTLKTDGTDNGSQTLLNLVGGTNVTLTDNGTGTVTIDATGGGSGSPGGSNTQLQYNNAGSFGGISGATTNGTAVTYSAGNLIAADVTASGSSGLLLQANNGTDVALLGAGGGAGATFYGGVNIAGELTVDTNTLYVDATNNEVGVGTTSPQLKLHVNSSDEAQLILSGTDNLVAETSGVDFRYFNGGANTNIARILAYTQSGGGGDLLFQTASGGASAYSTKVKINRAGQLIIDVNNGSNSALTLTDGASYGEIQTFNSKPLYLNRQGNNIVMFGGTAGLIGVNTTAPTHTLTLGSTSTGIALYNTADQTTNYERGRLYWNSNVLTLTTDNGGTGTARSLILTNSANRSLTISPATSAVFQFAAGSSGLLTGAISVTNSTSLSSGTYTQVSFTPTINQSSTAGYTALLINPTETTTGSGSKLLADFQVGGVSKFSVTNAAVTTISNTSGQTFTFSPVLGGANYPGIELLTTAGNGSFFRANTTSGVQLDMLSNAAVSGIIRTNNSYPLELRTNNTVGLTISTAQVGTFANNSIITANAITATGNAATIPITKGRNIVTNNSAATLTITLTTGAVNMQTVIVQILDFSAAAQTITWVNTENSTVTAPTTSNGSTTLPLTVGFIYNSATSKWRCIASA